MKIRCKMRLEEIHQLYWSSTARRYVFSPVCADEVPENQRFHRYTPSGRLELVVDNPDVHASYQLGKHYYFDSIPSPDEVAADAPQIGPVVGDPSSLAGADF